MALGARAVQVVHGIVAGLAAMVAAGAVAGLAGGVMLGRAAQALLFEITPANPVVLVTPLLLLGVTAAASALPPAWRAARIDPMLTIRNE